MRSEMKMHPS